MSDTSDASDVSKENYSSLSTSSSENEEPSGKFSESNVANVAEKTFKQVQEEVSGNFFMSRYDQRVLMQDWLDNHNFTLVLPELIDDLAECGRCGCVVANPDTHIRFHDQSNTAS